MKSSFNPGKLGSVFLTKQNQQSAFTQPLPKRPPAPSCPPCAGCQRPFSVVLQPKRNQTPGGTQGLSPPCCHPRGGFRAPHRVPWSRAGKRRARGREAAAVAWQPRRGRPRWRRRRGGGAAAGPGLGSGAPGVSGARSRHRGTGPAPGRGGGLRAGCRADPSVLLSPLGLREEAAPGHLGVALLASQHYCCGFGVSAPSSSGCGEKPQGHTRFIVLPGRQQEEDPSLWWGDAKTSREESLWAARRGRGGCELSVLRHDNRAKESAEGAKSV